jgi:hypothetical protein
VGVVFFVVSSLWQDLQQGSMLVIINAHLE